MKKLLLISSIAFLAAMSVASAQNYAFSNSLYVGSTGTDVVNLQTWLISNGFSIPSISSGATAKGYFGSQTQMAVEAYQRSVGITPTGFFGPVTIAKINGGGVQTSSPIRVTSPNGGEVWQIGTTQAITWNSANTSPNGPNRTVDISITANCPTGYTCGYMPKTIARGVNDNGYYPWNVGYLNDGSVLPSASSNYRITVCQSGTASNLLCDSSDNYFTIASNLVTNGSAPVISGVSAPTSLAVGQTGTWTVNARDPQNGYLAYSVNWGDAYSCPSGYACNASALAAPSYAQTSTFTHSYASAGTYTATFTARNTAGLTAQTSTTVTVTNGGVTTNGPLRVISPNGGENWMIGTTQNITWASSYYSGYSNYSNYSGVSTVDIKLIPYQQPCVSQVCPMYMLAPYTIATNVSANQNSYSWNVGSVVPFAPNTPSGVYAGLSTPIAPAGQYTIQLCQSGTSNCDSSDGTFTISSSGSTSNLPDINIVSPNGGEVWQTGTNQTVTVDVTGDSTKIDNSIEVFLVNSANQQTLIDNYYTGNSRITVGKQNISVSVPYTISSGTYRLFVNLGQYLALPCVSSVTNCPDFQSQAYDYSDNYFTVTNGSYYNYNTPNLSQCPAGYTCTVNTPTTYPATQCPTGYTCTDNSSTYQTAQCFDSNNCTQNTY